MKVTVSFGSVRVLVPCGAGDLLVRDLVREATLRFKKATGQGPDTWVGVRALRASSGGILDPDDRVCDVADDRETLTAECSTSQTAPQPRAAQADGASGSSAGTASPDMFRGGGGVGGSIRADTNESCVEVGAARDEGAPGLQVRRGSEPSLLQDALPATMQVCSSTKRWSAAVVCREEARQKGPDSDSPQPHSLQPPAPHHFQRHTNRLSMQFSGPGSGVWLDAAERVQNYGSKSLPRDARREPLGQDTPLNQQNHRVEDMLRWVSGVNNVHSVPPVQERPLDLLPEVGGSERAVSGVEPSGVESAEGGDRVSVTLVKGERGLGFTITTRDNPTGGHCPIYIKNILPKGAAVVDGRLRAGDRLVGVNGVSVWGLTQQQVVSMLRNTPTDHSVTLVVHRPSTRGPHRGEPQQSPTKYVEKAIVSPNNVTTKTENTTKPTTENGRVSTMVNALNQNRVSNGSVRGRINKSSSKDNLLNKDQSSDKALQDALNTSSNSVLSLKNRLILRLDVPVHDSEKAGLGISVKGKVTVGSDPQDLGIFIKSVLNGGAASRDGRLHTNDQLLSVNNVSLVGQSNAEAMETLRRALLHARPTVRGSISLTIARRTESMDSLARWKDDTPPSNETISSTDNSNSQNFTNTVIYNTNKSAERSVDSNKTDKHNSKPTSDEPTYDSNDGRKRHASTVVHINNNSWVANQSDDSKGYLERDKDASVASHESKRDSFEWSRLEGWNPVIDRLTGLRNESYYMATQESLSNGRDYRPMGHVHMTRSPPAHHNVIIEEEYGTTKGSSNGVCSSESECGEGQFSRDAVGRRSMSEKRHAALDANANPTYRRIKELKALNALQVGPSLGMRKSSSLESLQTAIQENQRNPRSEPIYARAHPPLKHWLTDDNHGPDIIRGSPQQSSLSHKKPSLFKSLSTMFRKNSKPSKKGEGEIYGRSQPGRSSEKSLSRDALDRHTRLSERGDDHKHRSSQHSRQASSDRSEKEERRSTPARTAPARQLPQALDSAWGPAGHYANNEELQQDLYARREKLSEVQIGQMRRQVNAQRAKAVEETRRVGGYAPQRPYNMAPRPHSTYYEYETTAAPPRRPGKLSHYH